MRCKIPFTERQKVAFAWFQTGFFFYSGALKKLWFSLVRWRASLTGKRLRKLVSIRSLVIKKKIYLLSNSHFSGYLHATLFAQFGVTNQYQCTTKQILTKYQDLFFNEDMYVLSDLFSSSFFHR